MTIEEVIEKLPALSSEDPESAAPRVQSVARAMAILLAVARSPKGLRAMDIAPLVGLGRQATYHLLHTLVGSRMLVRGRDNCYVMGLEVGTLAQAFNRHLALPERLAPIVRSVAEKTGETAYATGWFGGEIVTMVTAEGSHLVKAVASPGYYEHAHARATGKLLLALAPAEVREGYLSKHPLVAVSPNTIVDRDVLNAALRKIRELGFAFDIEEFSVGLSCLAIPVGTEPADFVIGISMPTERFRAKHTEYLQAMRQIVLSR